MGEGPRVGLQSPCSLLSRMNGAKMNEVSVPAMLIGMSCIKMQGGASGWVRPWQAPWREPLFRQTPFQGSHVPAVSPGVAGHQDNIGKDLEMELEPKTSYSGG